MSPDEIDRHAELVRVHVFSHRYAATNDGVEEAMAHADHAADAYARVMTSKVTQ